MLWSYFTIQGPFSLYDDRHIITSSLVNRIIYKCFGKKKELYINENEKKDSCFFKGKNCGGDPHGLELLEQL
jgi:hypothetical protein